MDQFEGRIAVVTGGGTGMGRELCLALAKAGAHVATCDVSMENMADTKSLCEAAAPEGTRITIHQCDVSDEDQVLAFKDAVVAEHLLNFINGAAGLEQVLRIGVPQPVCAGTNTGLFHGGFDKVSDRIWVHWTVRRHQSQKQRAAFGFGPATDDIGADHLQGLIRYGQFEADRIFSFPYN